MVLGSVLRVIGLLMTTLVSFFLMPFIVHTLGDKLYGYWSLLGAVMGYYGLLDLGIVSAVEFQVATALGNGDEGAARRAVVTSFLAFAGIGCIACLLTVILSVIAPTFVSEESDIVLFRKILLVMGVGFAVGFPGRVYVGALSAHLRWDLVAIVDMVVLVLRSGLIVLVLQRQGGVIGLAVVTLSADLLAYGLEALILHLLHPGLGLSLSSASVSVLKQLLKYGAKASVIRVADQLRFCVDGWVVAAVVGVSAVTHYAIASRLAFSVMGLIIASLGILSPWFSQLLGSGAHKEMRRTFDFGTRVSAALTTLTGVILLLYGRAFIAQWMGAAYTDAFLPLCVLMTAVAVAVAQQPSVSYLYGVSKHGMLAAVTLAEGAVNLVLSIFLGSRYGMIGVALGTLIPMLVSKVIVLPMYTCRQLDVPVFEYFLRILGFPVLVTVLCTAGPWVVVFRYMTPNSILGIVGLVICNGMTSMAMTYYVLLSASERQAISKTIFPSLRWPVGRVANS